MTREEANARLVELGEQIRPLLQEMADIARTHQLSHDIALEKIGNYTTHVKVNRWEDQQVETWVSSSYDDYGWDSSDC